MSVQGYDYYGDVVNKAARIEAKALGGQTLASAEIVMSLLEDSRNQCVIRLIGSVKLKGINGENEIYSILPKGLELRGAFLICL